MTKAKGFEWSDKAKDDLFEIYKFNLGKGSEKALEIITEIILQTEELIFTQQWQKDEFDPNFRRIFVNRNYRVLYKSFDSNISIVRVFPTKKNPTNFKL